MTFESMTFESIISRGSGVVNEDICGAANGRIWVLDGATGVSNRRLFNGASDAAFLVDRVSRALFKEEDQNLENRELLAKAIKRAAADVDLPPPSHTGEDPVIMPGFAMVMAHICDGAVKIDCLSDCAAVTWDGSTAQIFTDKRTGRISARTRRVLDYVNKHKDTITPEAGKELVRRQIVKNRRMVNREGGYFVGTFDGAAVEHTLRFCTDSPKQLLLCSDGFFRLFEYGVMTLENFFMSNMTLGEALLLLRNHENTMETGAEYKRHDDTTAVMIHL